METRKERTLVGGFFFRACLLGSFFLASILKVWCNVYSWFWEVGVGFYCFSIAPNEFYELLRIVKLQWSITSLVNCVNGNQPLDTQIDGQNWCETKTSWCEGIIWKLEGLILSKTFDGKYSNEVSYTGFSVAFQV